VSPTTVNWTNDCQSLEASRTRSVETGP
jgi:hypothetical protein